MFNRRNIFIFLGIITTCSIFIEGLFFVVTSISFIIVLYMSRGIFYTLKANRQFVKKNDIEGYRILTKAYNAGGIPMVVINGFIYISLKYGHTDIALEAIEKVLSGNVSFKVKDGQRSMVLTQKAIYLWQTGNIKGGVDLLNELYEDDYRTTNFYGNFGCLLYLSGDYFKAEKICIEAYDYGPQDKVTLDNLVAVYIKLKKWDEAKRYFNELMELKPTFAEAFYHGAILELNNNNIDVAQDLLNRSKEFKIHNISSISSKDIISLEDKLKAN